MLIAVLAVALLALAEVMLMPALAAAAAQQARAEALNLLTAAVAEQMADCGGADDYQQLIQVERDRQGHITLMVTDTLLLNSLLSAIVLAANEKLSALTEQRISVPLGVALGHGALSGLGPDLPFRCVLRAAPTVTVADRFESAGVNQTRHSIYLELSAEILLIAPLATQPVTVSTTVLLAEGIIVGDTPETYVEISR